eukprot:11209329-Lingulodinium_polyedra.AAC.1
MTTTSSSAGSIVATGPQMSYLNLHSAKPWLPPAKGCETWCETWRSGARAVYAISGSLVAGSVALKESGQGAAIT